MNPSITSKEVILGVCRRLAAEKGLAAINMRSVAQECGVALGTLYNYYTDKDALLLAVVEDIWKEIFHRGQECRTGLSFPEHVGYLFDCVQQDAARYPDFFAGHSLLIAKARRGEARSTMEHYFEHMKAGMLTVLRADSAVRPGAFSPGLSESQVVDFALDHILLLLMQGRTDCTALVELLRRLLYGCPAP